MRRGTQIYHWLAHVGAVVVIAWLLAKNRSDILPVPIEPLVRTSDLTSARVVSQTVAVPASDEARNRTPSPALPPPSAEDWLAEQNRQWSDPSFLAQRREAAVLAVEKEFGLLFDQLADAPPEVLKKLIDRLAQLQVDRDKLFARDPNLNSPAKIELRIREMAALDRAAEGQIKSLLGDKNFSAYSDFKQKAPYRETVSDISNALRARGVKISGDQQERLLSAYSSALRGWATAESQPGQAPLAWSAMTKQQQQEYQARFQENLNQHLASVLSPEQTAQFIEVQSTRD